MSQETQIFQTTSVKRWRNFKWSFRILLMIALFFIAVLVIAILSGTSPTIPNLEARSKAYQGKMDPANPLTLLEGFNKKYKGFKIFLNKKTREDSIKNARQHTFNIVDSIPNIRAAFYTPWTGKTSLPDLEKYGSNLNMIFPEWFFIDTVTQTLQTRIDSAGLALMRAKKLEILPILSNFNSTLKDFDGKLLHAILSNDVKRKAFISQVADTLSYYHFDGINIDFEELKETNNIPLSTFQKELYEVLHARSLKVTMDVAVDNNDYDYTKLSTYNDYVILMAYDQYNTSTGAGPVSAQKWIEGAVERTAKKIEPGKIILGIAGYGYDWYKTREGKDTCESITYNYAINKAKIKNVKVDFDNDSYNCHFVYLEDVKGEDGELMQVKHEVWCTDAATTFNILRFSDEYEIAGTALWRMGSEDARMWTYYKRDLSNESLARNPFSFDILKTIPIIPDNVGYDGEGEVLNIIASPQAGKINFEIDKYSVSQ